MDGRSFVHPGAKALRHAVELACGDLGFALEQVCGVYVENKGLTATVHYRLAHLDLVGWIEATIHSVLRPYKRWLILKPALKAWEVRPRINWTKGSALSLVLQDRNLMDPLVICAGDDATDEDMFDVAPGVVSIQVGRNSNTKALYQIDSPVELAKFLSELLASQSMQEVA